MEIHGKLVDIHNQTMFAATVIVEGGRIADIRRNSHRGSHFIVPGFYDAHCHLENTHMIPSEFARIAVRHGTVSTTFATHHLSNVMREEGMHLLRENAAHTPLKCHFPSPTHLPHCSSLCEGRAQHAIGKTILIHASNLQTLLPLLNEDPRRCLFSSSHISPDQFALGHINLLIKRAIELGMDPIDAITCGTYRDEPDAGLLRVGDPADLALVENLESLRVLETYIDGTLVFKGEPLFPRVPFKQLKPATFRQITSQDLRIPATESEVSVILVDSNSSIIKKHHLLPTLKNGECIADPQRDLLKLVSIGKGRKPIIQFSQGFGLKKGAIASSISGQLMAVGTHDQDLTNALNALAEVGGGLAISNQGKTDILALPVGGILSPLDGEELALRHSNLEIASTGFGTANAMALLLKFV